MEVEIKLNVRPAIEGGPVLLFTRLTMHPQLGGEPVGGITKHEIQDIYYDTPDLTLAKAGVGLRFRMVDEKPFVTLKVNQFHEGALTRREECEEPLTQESLDSVLSHIKEFVGDGPFPLDAFRSGKPCGPLSPVLEVDTARLVRPIGSQAELTLDMVEYPVLSAYPFYDIEVESKTGKAGERFLRQVEEELQALARGDLAPAKMSKLERGIRLKQKVAGR